MKTMIYKWIAGATAVAGVAALSSCGPAYTEDRWYAQDYYAQHPAAVAQPQYAAQPVVEQAPMAQPDGQFADLSPYGQWEMTEEYGRIWVPYANRTPGWRPYFYGQWEYTDWGWSWVSDEVWGAGPYHYGRWTWMNGRNWIWIPDYTWGPAWVTWSHGGGCVGWAPMGPGGASWGDIHAHSTYWTYVPTGQFGSGKVQHVVVAASEVPRIHSQTVMIEGGSQIRGHNGTAVTYSSGPPREQVQQWTSRPVNPRPIEQIPSVQPRRIPATAAAPTGGTYGSATTPPPGRGVTPSPAANTTGTAPTRPGAGSTVPGGVPTGPGTNPQTRPGVGTPTAPGVVPATRPGVGTPGATQPVVTPPTRPGVGTVPTTTPQVNPPTRPGVGTTPVEPPTRPGAGYTGPGPVAVPPQTTVPRPTPPPATGNNYAPQPTRYVPPVYTPPSRPSTPTYTPPTYNAPSRPSTPSYSPPTYNAPSRPAAPSYSPPAQQQQRFSPPPAHTAAPSRPAAAPAPAPQRRR